MTPDQIYHRLCDAKVLKTKGGVRSEKVSSMAVVPGEDGTIKARSEDGSRMVLKSCGGGKSLARRLMEQEQAKQAVEKKKNRRRRRGD